MSWTRPSRHLIRAVAAAPGPASNVLATRLPAIARLQATQHGPGQQRAPFSQLAALRRQGDDGGNGPQAKEREGNPNLDSGTSVPTKGALNKAMNDAADKEGGGKKSGQQQREQHKTQAQSSSDNDNDIPQVAPDAVADNQARGRTGGGSRLGSSSENAPPQPKILNASVPGGGADMSSMTDDQKKEVDQHNKEFSQKFDRGQRAEDDKVDKTFWNGGNGNKEKVAGEKAAGGGDNTEGKKAGGKDAEGKDDTVDKTF